MSVFRYTLRLFLMLMIVIPVKALPKLDSKYTIVYGNPNAPIQVVEYFSFGCWPCLQWFAKDFEEIRKAYVDTGKVAWVFHPHPVDLDTVQWMACLERLTPSQKYVVFETLMLERYEHPKIPFHKVLVSVGQLLNIDVTDLISSSVLQKTEAFKAVVTYNNQPNELDGTPTVVIQNEVMDAFPTRQLLDQKISAYLNGFRSKS